MQHAAIKRLQEMNSEWKAAEGPGEGNPRVPWEGPQGIPSGNSRNPWIDTAQ